MMNAALRGKPDAGNPHVRFDEGEVALAKPRRGSLLYKKLLCVVLSAGSLTGVSALAATPAPSAAQRRYLETEMMGIIHFGLNTYVDREWGYGDTPPSVFNPTALDPDQWVRAALDGGLRRLVLVCKHHDGFCLFPSKLNADYTVANTPWKGGKGDLVRDFREACRRHGVEFGAYLSPWDRHQANYATDAYVDYFHGQWDELLAGYGPISEIWLDGANGGDGWYGGAKERRKLPQEATAYYRFADLLEKVVKHNPQAIAFGGGRSPNCATWCGNEIGMNPATCWNVRDGVFIPNESDTPLRKNGWFWHPEDRPKSLAELVDVYFLTVGRNSVLDLGLAPDRAGRLGDDDVRRLKEFGDYVRALNAVDFAEGASVDRAADGNRLVLTLRLKKPQTVNVIDLREEIADGQSVGTWTAEAETDGAWRKVAEGTTVGYRRMERFEAVTAAFVRVTLVGEGRAPVLKKVSLRFAPVVKQEEADVFQQWRSPCKVREVEPGVLEYDFLRRISVNAIQFVPPKDRRTKGLPDRYEILKSDDGKTWTKVQEGEFGNLRANPVRQIQSLPGPTTMRYARVKALHALDGAPDWTDVLFEVFTK